MNIYDPPECGPPQQKDGYCNDADDCAEGFVCGITLITQGICTEHHCCPEYPE